MKSKINISEELKKDLARLHLNSGAVTLAALITVFHLQFEVAKHSNHTAVVQKPSEIRDLFEREREIHPAHGSYARVRYVTATSG